MTAGEIRALLLGRWKAFNGRDSVALASIYANDCIVESPTGGIIRGRAAIDGVNRHWFAAFPDIAISPDEILVAGNRAVECVTARGTDTGGFLGQAPTGKPFHFQSVLLYTLENHQILHERRVWDWHGLVAQLAGTHGQMMSTDIRAEFDAARNASVYRAALERARMERELQVAADIQRALLPELLRDTSAFEVAAASVPCRTIGGDFFDSYDLPNGAFGFCLGDVAGKGPAAALLAAESQGILATQSQVATAPSEVIACLNRVLMRRAVAARFTTVVYGLVDSDGQLTYCNAGHNPPLLIGRHGVERLETGGPVVGAFEDVRYEDATLRLHDNDLLVMFSDGITEAEDPNGIEFGEGRLVASIEANRGLPTRTILDSLLDEVRRFAASDVRRDDQTALVLRYAGASSVAS